jgi:hypothetical protein
MTVTASYLHSAHGACTSELASLKLLGLQVSCSECARCPPNRPFEFLGVANEDVSRVPRV